MKVAVVIPVYRELNDLEKISLTQCRKILGRYPLIFVAPEGKIFSCFELGEMTAYFPEEYFRSVKSYSDLLLSSKFYEAFRDFEYILLYQLDAFVFYDALEEFCSLGYDYIGAPWPRYAWKGARYAKTPQVGNGGFSLRKVSACRKLLTRAESLSGWTAAREKYIEDAFFATCGMTPETEFNVAPVNVAKLFAMEWQPAHHVKKLDGLPFGCHAWTNFYADFYVELFRKLGYDLSPFRSQMETNDDYKKQVPLSLTNVALNRLTRRIEHGQPLLHYLPTKKFASIRVIRSPEAVKILTQLLTEENFLSDKVFIYDEETWTDLLNDVTPADLPHLIIVADYDASLIAALESHGLCYGEHVISFQREYLKRCEEFLRKFGR